MNIPVQSTPADSAANNLFWAGLAIAIGALGVVITSALYAASPPQAALPVPNPVMADALRGMVNGQYTIIAAGTVGVISDVIFAAGAFALMVTPRSAQHRFQQIGWAWIAISNLIFIVVDGLSAGVLTQLAALDSTNVALVGFKRLFDILFIVGTIAFGFGGLAVFVNEFAAKAPLFPRSLNWLGVIISLAGLVGALLYFSGLNLALVIGVSIAIGSVLFLLYGIQLMQQTNEPS